MKHPSWGRQTQAPVYAENLRQAVERLLCIVALSLETSLDWPEDMREWRWARRLDDERL